MGLQTDRQDIQEVGLRVLGVEFLHFLAMVGNPLHEVHSLGVEVSGSFADVRDLCKCVVAFIGTIIVLFDNFVIFPDLFIVALLGSQSLSLCGI